MVHGRVAVGVMLRLPHRIIVGTEAGTVEVFNASTGETAALRHPTPNPPTCSAKYPTAICCSISNFVPGVNVGRLPCILYPAGLELEGCRATLASTQEEGVGVVAMDASRDALFVGDSAGYIHVLRLALCAKGALQPLVQLERVPPAGEAGLPPMRMTVSGDLKVHQP
jgi:hypothetical protein